MVALLGIAALALDVSYMYDKRNRLFAAADAAAKSGAMEVQRNPLISATALQAFANAAVTSHGFTPGAGTTVTVNHPPLLGPFNDDQNYVEVFVSEPTSTFLGGVLGRLTITPEARAVAGRSPGRDCLVTLGDTSASPPAMTVGGSTLTMSGCRVSSAGNLVSTNPGSRILAAETAVAGTCSGSAACTDPAKITNLTQSTLPPTDPLKGLEVPANPGGCTAAPAAVAAVITLAAGRCYSSVVMTTSNVTINITGSGVLYLTGPFVGLNNTTVNATGVMFYLAGTAATGPCVSTATAGCFKMGQNATFRATAATSGPYTGILMFQDRDNHLTANFDGNNPYYNLSGAMYFPGADVSFGNGVGASNDCMLFVARSLNIDNGNGSFSNACTGYGGSPLHSVSLAE